MPIQKSNNYVALPTRSAPPPPSDPYSELAQDLSICFGTKTLKKDVEDIVKFLQDSRYRDPIYRQASNGAFICSHKLTGLPFTLTIFERPGDKPKVYLDLKKDHQLGSGGFKVATESYLLGEGPCVALRMKLGPGTISPFTMTQIEERFGKLAQQTKELDHPLSMIPKDFVTYDSASKPGFRKNKSYVPQAKCDMLDYLQQTKSNALSTRQALDFAYTIAHQIRALHDAGFAHRDIKPDNILLEEIEVNGRKGFMPQLADFDSINDKATYSFFGTPGFMDENAKDNRHKSVAMQKRSDLFAFGITLGIALYGREFGEGKTLHHELNTALKRNWKSDDSQTNALQQIIAYLIMPNLPYTINDAIQALEKARDIKS